MKRGISVMVKKNTSKKTSGKGLNAKSNKKNQAQAKVSSSKTSNKKKKVSASNKISSKKQLQAIASSSSLNATQSFYDDSIYVAKSKNKKVQNSKKLNSHDENKDINKGRFDKTKISTRIKFPIRSNRQSNSNEVQVKSSKTSTNKVEKNSSFSGFKIFLSILLMGLAIFIGYKMFSGSMNGEHSTLNDQNMNEIFIDDSSSDINHQSQDISVDEPTTKETKSVDTKKKSSHTPVVKDNTTNKQKASLKDHKKKEQNINKKSKKSHVRK